MEATLKIKGQDVKCTLVKETKYTKQYKPVVDGYFTPIAEASNGYGKRLMVVEITDDHIISQYKDFTIETHEYDTIQGNICLRAEWPTI